MCLQPLLVRNVIRVTSIHRNSACSSAGLDRPARVIILVLVGLHIVMLNVMRNGNVFRAWVRDVAGGFAWVKDVGV